MTTNSLTTSFEKKLCKPILMHLQNFVVNCPPDAKSMLQYLVLVILVSTICEDITAEGTPEQFTLVKDFPRPLKLTKAELKAVIDNQLKYMDEIIVPNSSLENTSC